jgi:predicted RNA-binding protein YlxR (DUF448 family)
VAPQRRCIGCGRSAAKSELVRIGLSGESDSARKRAVVDRRAILPGRGAYLCRDADADASVPVARECLRLATRRGAFSRALRSVVTLDRELVESPDGLRTRAKSGVPSPLLFTKP